MDEKDYKKLVENAPILEFDPDSAEQSKEFFFEGGKKPFEQFNKVKELGITKCLLFLPREFDHLTEIYDKCEKIKKSVKDNFVRGVRACLRLFFYDGGNDF